MESKMLLSVRDIFMAGKFFIYLLEGGRVILQFSCKSRQKESVRCVCAC